MPRVYTAESVTQGHPDKVADQISDAIVDACLEADPNSRVACEVLVSRQLIAIAGEITTQASLNYEQIAKQVIREIGYEDPGLGFSPHECRVISAIGQQSPDIAQGVDHSLDDPEEVGAGDQGIMVGFACDETYQAMPLAYQLARNITTSVRLARQSGKLAYLRPDGKAQVTLKYDDDQSNAQIQAIVLSCQHEASVSLETIRKDLCKLILNDIDPALIHRNTRFLINPTGRFVLGGPAVDTGLTGRKIIVDTYGPFAFHGGGAFSGKDPTKVDRSGAYACRYLAKNIVKAGLARQAQVQVAYAIGRASPVGFTIDLWPRPEGPIIDKEKLASVCLNLLDMKPSTLIERFDLNRPIYCQTAYDGHFGREDVEFPWERLDLVESLQAAFNLDAFYDATPF